MKFYCFRLSDYGFTKLIDLIESIHDVVHIVENRKGQKILKLTAKSNNEPSDVNVNGAFKETLERFEPPVEVSSFCLSVCFEDIERNFTNYKHSHNLNSQHPKSGCMLTLESGAYR